ncbi:hypothetical protein HYALB_00010230 [Hymenoscyphus albidus]|uniref:catechol O-methyltransferase n=1 Tax=Hymenoscyphus albidus TaxID=595503 RepID=A0A9N9LPS9_9HELO|nr:hypothetical protein HYALB_00010230 [Hymenoscyphus albidus]
MPSFDESKAYKAKDKGIYYDDGREEELVKFIQERPRMQGSPFTILNAIDEFARTQRYLMNIGEDKGKIVTEVIQNTKPEVMVELGGYCGYSTILFANAMRAAGGKKFYCLEKNPKFAKNIKTLVELAGLHDIVEVLVGSSDESINSLSGTQKESYKVDMVFIDHHKPLYTTDLKLCESLGFIGKGTVIIADNVIYPGNPEYLKYVRSSVEEKRAAISTAEEGSQRGNPNLKYRSELRKSYEPSGEPDGVEITVCEGEAHES